jgi:hypothetical protein
MRPNAIYSSGQVAGLVGLPPNQLYGLIDRGAVPAPPVGAGARRHWTADDIERLRAILEQRPPRVGASRPNPSMPNTERFLAVVESVLEDDAVVDVMAPAYALGLHAESHNVEELKLLMRAIQILTEKVERALRERQAVGAAGNDREVTS